MFQSFGLLWNGWWNSPTMDEPAHLQSALAIHHWGHFGIYRVNPPLVRMVACSPAYWGEGLIPYPIQGLPTHGVRKEFAWGELLFGKYPTSAMTALAWCRMMLIPLVLAGTVVVWRWTSSVFGIWPAMVATSLWVFSPMILGHGALITPDVGAAVLGMVSMFKFRKWLATGGWNNTWWLGIATGTAMLTKFTWAPILPISYVLIYLFWRLLIMGKSRRIHGDFWQLTAAASLALLVIHAGYGFDRSFQRLGEVPLVSARFAVERSTSESEKGQEALAANRFTNHWLGNLRVPLPQLYLQGIDLQARDFEPEQMPPSFLMGVWRDSGWWYYYLLAAMVKVPISTLLIAIMAAMIVLGQACRSRTPWRLTKEMTRYLGELLVCLVPAVLLLVLVSSQSNFNHHYRYVIAAYPLGFIGIGGVLGRVSRPLSSTVRRATMALVAIQVIIVSCSFPNWIGYFNVIARSVRPTSWYLSNSNIDWGQDLLRLKHWRDRNSDKSPLYVVTFAPLCPKDLGVDSDPLHLPIDSKGQPVIDLSSLPEGWYAISTCAKQGQLMFLFSQTNRGRSLDHGFPITDNMILEETIGSSIQIFRFPRERSRDK